jgi:hypothetical protein
VAKLSGILRLIDELSPIGSRHKKWCRPSFRVFEELVISESDHLGNLRVFDGFADLLENTGNTWQVQLAGKGGRRFDNGSPSGMVSR